jgi:hypothetical protein
MTCAIANQNAYIALAVGIDTSAREKKAETGGPVLK